MNLATKTCRVCGILLTDATLGKPLSLATVRSHGSMCHRCHKTYQLEHYYKHRERRCAALRQRNRELRQELVAAYGGRCACCGVEGWQFLTIDHVDGEGTEHRAALKNQGRAIYRWLRARGYPQEGFQILCWNCNQAKYAFGICPHAERRQTETGTE